MTRTEFLKGYAERSGMSARWAALGFIELDEWKLIAVPCECGEEGCEGWAVYSPERILDYLQMYAPEPLREAYQEAVKKAGGK
jgi:hypothetical protein